MIAPLILSWQLERETKDPQRKPELIKNEGWHEPVCRPLKVFYSSTLYSFIHYTYNHRVNTLQARGCAWHRMRWEKADWETRRHMNMNNTKSMTSMTLYHVEDKDMQPQTALMTHGTLSWVLHEMTGCVYTHPMDSRQAPLLTHQLHPYCGT